MGGPGGEAGDELLLLGEHLLLAAEAGLELLPADLPLPQVEVEVAAVGGGGAARHLDDPGDDPVHELPVVAGHQQGAFKFAAQPFLKPEDRFDIEVVGRFVEEQNVRVDG